MKEILPLGIEQVPYLGDFGEKGALYRIKEEAAFDAQTLALIENLKAKYPDCQEIFSLIEEELGNRPPIPLPGGADPARDFTYRESPNKWEFTDVFSIVGSFSPSDEQFCLLRHFLFHPDLDVRHAAAGVVERRRGKYDLSLQKEYKEIIRNDPDCDQRLEMWIRKSRRFWAENGFNPWKRFLSDILLTPPAKDPQIAEPELKNYFGLGRANFFTPREAHERLRREKSINDIQRQIQIIDELLAMGKEGEASGEREERLKEEMQKIDLHFFDQRAGIPYVGTMLGQVWRLDTSGMIKAISGVLNRPEDFIITDYTEDEAQVVKLGVLACAFFPERSVAKIFLRQILGREKWWSFPEVITALARVSYLFSPKEILAEIYPLTLNHKEYCYYPTRKLAYGLCLAIARDIEGEPIPQSIPREISLFGF